MKKLLCFLFGHRYAVVREFGHGQRMVACARCYRCWGMHDGVRAFVQWDDDLASLYTPERMSK